MDNIIDVRKHVNKYNLILNKYILLSSIGLLIFGFLYLFDKEKIYLDKSEIINNKEILSEIKESKEKCYKILIDTIYEYKDKYKDDRIKQNDFNLFMKEMWYKDYLIMLEQLKEYNNTFHRYNKWEILFNK